jgi:1-aminocyclopropane-1-carboxylate deaminase/D-cysteine desulfhydrase-like pyridoxal-dependent ACC family enzyme
VPLLPGPTPLERLDRFSDAIGVETWIKRDDIGPFTVAGAKARKLELVAARARDEGARALLTIGPPQSNTCRAVAAACAAVGIEAHLVFANDRPEALTGNALLASLMGATLHWAGRIPLADYHVVLARHAARLAEEGIPHQVIDPGCSNGLGIIGMMLGYLEMTEQARASGLSPRSIVHASATGGVWAGLELGAVLTGGPRPRPVLVLDSLFPDMRLAYAERFNRAAREAGLSLHYRPQDVVLDESQLAVPFGQADDATIDAIRTLAQLEGIMCDPMYTGRALASFIAAAKRKEIEGPLVFWHTGGLQALGDPEIMKMLNKRRAD